MPYADPAARSRYQREWMRRRRRAWLDEHGPCVDCGSGEDLEVDHVDRSTKIDHRVWSWAQARRSAELAKCVARCRPCHLVKSNAEQASDAPHGTRARYKAGCTCAPCKGANAAYIRAWRAALRGVEPRFAG